MYQSLTTTNLLLRVCLTGAGLIPFSGPVIYNYLQGTEPRFLNVYNSIENMLLPIHGLQPLWLRRTEHRVKTTTSNDVIINYRHNAIHTNGHAVLLMPD